MVFPYTWMLEIWYEGPANSTRWEGSYVSRSPLRVHDLIATLYTIPWSSDLASLSTKVPSLSTTETSIPSSGSPVAFRSWMSTQ